MDLQSLSGSFTPVDIIANFKIETILERRLITVKGHPQSNFTGSVQVGFCVSDCHLCEEYNSFDPGYVGSGLSLVRLKNQ